VEKQPDKNTVRKANSALKLADLAFRMTGIVVAGMFLGRWLDTKAQLSKPYLTLIFSLVSVGLAIYWVLRQVNPPPKLPPQK
jgi:F0F1-type ATP synthase assembly protein I